MQIGCYYDSIYNVYVLFTLPYVFDLPFMIMNDTIHTCFNQYNDRLDCLTPMLYMKIPGVIVLIGENEILSKSFLKMLKQGSHRSKYLYLIFIYQIFFSLQYVEKSILIMPNGIYKMEGDDDFLAQFNKLEIRRRYENQSSNSYCFILSIIFDRILFRGYEFVNTTLTWLTWMPHIRIFNMDNELLSQLILNHINIDQFLFLEMLIIRQAKNSLNDELLTILSRLGKSASIHTIYLRQYRRSLHLTINDLYLLLYQISHNFYRLKVMTIEFHEDTLFDSQILENLTDIQKKTCHLDYVYFSKTYMEFCFAQN